MKKHDFPLGDLDFPVSAVRKLDFLESKAIRRRIYGEEDYEGAARRLNELRLSHRHPYSWGLEEFLASDEIEKASPICLRGILAFGYLGDQRADISRECLLQSRQSGEGIGFGLFTLAMLCLRERAGGESFDVRFALGLLDEATRAGCAIANEWRVRILLSERHIDLPRMPVSDEEWNEYTWCPGDVLNNDEHDQVLSLMHTGKKRPRFDVSPRSVRREEGSCDPARAADCATEGDPGWSPDTLDFAVDVLWRRGRFREALRWIERGLLLKASWALEDLLDLTLCEGEGLEPVTRKARLEAREAIVTGVIFKPSLVLAADDGYHYDSILEIAEMLEKGKNLPGDRALAKLLRERAEPAKREYDAKWRPDALSQEEIDSMLVGIREKRNRES